MTKYKNIAGAKIKAADGVYVEDGEVTDLTEEDAAVYLAGGYVQALDEDGIDDTIAGDAEDDELTPETENRIREGDDEFDADTRPSAAPTAPSRKRRSS